MPSGSTPVHGDTLRWKRRRVLGLYSTAIRRTDISQDGNWKCKAEGKLQGCQGKHGRCEFDLLKGCSCDIVFEPAEVLVQPIDLPLYSQQELEDAAAEIFHHVWGGDLNNVPGWRNSSTSEGGSTSKQALAVYLDQLRLRLFPLFIMILSRIAAGCHVVEPLLRTIVHITIKALPNLSRAFLALSQSRLWTGP